MLEIFKHQSSANLTARVRKRRSVSDKTLTAAASSDLLPEASAHEKVKMVTHYTWPEALHRGQEQVSASLGASMHGILGEVHKYICDDEEINKNGLKMSDCPY